MNELKTDRRGKALKKNYNDSKEKKLSYHRTRIGNRIIREILRYLCPTEDEHEGK